MEDRARNRSKVATVEGRATSPVAGAIAGILFAVIFSLSVAIIIATASQSPGDTRAWLESGADRFQFAIALLPFAGLFFLWFIAVSACDSAARKTSSSARCFWAAACSSSQ